MPHRIFLVFYSAIFSATDCDKTIKLGISCLNVWDEACWFFIIKVFRSIVFIFIVISTTPITVTPCVLLDTWRIGCRFNPHYRRVIYRNTYHLYPVMANGIRTGDPRGFNKGRISKFREGSWVRQTPEEGRSTYRPNRCGNNNKDEDNSRKNLNDKKQIRYILNSVRGGVGTKGKCQFSANRNRLLLVWKLTLWCDWRSNSRSTISHTNTLYIMLQNSPKSIWIWEMLNPFWRNITNRISWCMWQCLQILIPILYFYTLIHIHTHTHTHTHAHAHEYIYIVIHRKICFVLSELFSVAIHHHHHHHVAPLARISLTLSRHFSLSFIAFSRSSGLHPVSSHSCCM